MSLVCTNVAQDLGLLINIAPARFDSEVSNDKVAVIL